VCPVLFSNWPKKAYGEAEYLHLHDHAHGAVLDKYRDYVAGGDEK